MKESGLTEKKYLPTVEPDMRPRPYSDEDPSSTRIFKNRPLIGDMVLSDAALEKMHANAKKYIDATISSRERRQYMQLLYEQVALVVVNYAKKWNSHDEGKFSRYIAMQFGYRDDSGRIWRIITEALDIAFNKNDKFFIRGANGERQFYETVMAHSFGPADAWVPLIDLLFKFYSENLDWNYVPGDPLFARLVLALRKKFDNAVADDDRFLIDSNYYYLRVGIRRLIQERPGYSAFLFEQLVRRIHQLIYNEAQPSKRYILSLVDSWFINRINNAETVAAKEKGVKKYHDDVALDYSRISVKYIISNGMPALRIPAIRLFDETANSATAIVYNGDEAVSSVDLTVRGNELGKTIQAKTVPLITSQWKSRDINCRVKIKVGNAVIFDSDKSLYRQLLVFSDEKEVNTSKIRKERYQVFATYPTKLSGSNLDIVPYANGMCEIAFHKNFALEYAGNVIALDSSDIQGIRLVKPMVAEKSVYIYAGDSYLITDTNASLKVYCSDKKTASKYCVQINGENYALTKFYDAVADNRAVIPFRKNKKHDRVCIALIDLATGTTVFSEKYFVLPEFSVSFDKQYYIPGVNGFFTANANVKIENEEYTVQAQNVTEACLEYFNGIISIEVPYIQFEYIDVGRVFQGKYLRFSALTERSAIRIDNHTGMAVAVIIGDVAFQNESFVPIKQACSNAKFKANSLEISLETEDKKTSIGTVLFEDQFAVHPRIMLQDDKLIWDGGMSYIGDDTAAMSLLLHRNNLVCYDFPICIGEPVIASLSDFDDGDYTCKFVCGDKTLAEFDTFIGDERKARFSGKTISINHVTEDVESKAEPVKVKTVYIDQIKFVDTCYVDTEGDIFDVYSGCMYRLNFRGEKKYFSFNYNEARSKYKVNPVKIIYISNRYLRIVNEDDEGILYFNNEYSANPGNEITDNEPSTKAKGYHDILFYLYSVDEPAKSERIAVATAMPAKKKESSQIKLSPEPALTITSERKTMPEKSDIFSDMINVSQEAVIKSACEDRILVNAGPGTGKTWTLIERIIHLINEDVDPEAIQVLCFSRAAVDVVRRRMEHAIAENRVDVNANKVDIRTFDSFATQLLYWVKESDYNEIGSSFRIESLSYEDRIQRFISILRAQPQLIEQCDHLIVDEVQDLVLSRAEMVIELIRKLPRGSGVTLFGDACQAIYDYQVDRGISSSEFYKSIRDMGCFEYYSFAKNHRQISELQSYCTGYRDAILANNIRLCNFAATKIDEDLPDWTVHQIQQFQEDTLSGLAENGSLGVLTRSNAQALVISSIFRKKNISHTVQRRLAEDALSGWIALLFNRSPLRYYNEEDFVSAFKLFCPEYSKFIDPCAVWESISDTYSATTGRLSVPSLLQSIKNKGRCKGLFTEAQKSNITISTIHRSKGREYDSVLLLTGLLSAGSNKLEEHRVNYVALSRAKSKIYKVSLEHFYFRTLENRRSYSVGTAFSTGLHYLRYFEVGKKDDFDNSSYAVFPNAQKFIREKGRGLIGKEVYLKKGNMLDDGSFCYVLVLKENDMELAYTSQNFSSDICDAIRQIKNLPNHARVYENLFPGRFTDIYINDISSEIGIALGNETDVVQHDDTVTWNTLMLEGYAKAEY